MERKKARINMSTPGIIRGDPETRIVVARTRQQVTQGKAHELEGKNWSIPTQSSLRIKDSKAPSDRKPQLDQKWPQQIRRLLKELESTKI